MKALILEDNLPLAQTLQELLSQEGWLAHSFCSWKEATQELEKNSFDLLILDVLLPDKKGVEILEILSRKKLYFKKIVLISGFFDKSSILSQIPQNLKKYCVFFKKPIDEKTFLKFLKENKSTSSSKNSDDMMAFFLEKGLSEHPLTFYLPKSKTFDSKELISAIFLAHYKKFTGHFEITADNNKTALITFHKGQITQVASNSGESFFGTLLVEHGLSIEEDIELFLEDKESDKPLGERLVEKELLSPHMLNFILKEQIKIRLSEIMSYPSFHLNIFEKALENKNTELAYFNEIDLIEWMADSLQTESIEEFLNRFYLNAQLYQIEKSSKINKTLIHQKHFLQEYNLLFKNLKEGETIETILQNSTNKQKAKQLLYFGLLTKSIHLFYDKPETTLIQKQNFIAESILEKDTEDLFDVLNLPWNASIEEVKKNYKQLSQIIHPDLLPQKASEELKEKYKQAFYKISKSYEILKDEEKRKEYITVQKGENLITIMNKYEKGLSQIKEENYHQAIETLKSIADHKQAPSNIILYILWAKIKSHQDISQNHILASEIIKAIDSCSISLRTSPLFWYVKGLFFLNTKQYEKAEILFKKTLKIEKGFIPAKRDLLVLNQIIRKSKKKSSGLLNSLLKKSS